MSLDEGRRYSVAIRSAGNAEYLDRTLGSLARQVPAPGEVVLVLPHGKDYAETHGLPLKVVHAPASMIGQRDESVAACTHEAIVVMDDDIEFDVPDALANMIDLFHREKLDAVSPHTPGAYPSGLHRWVTATFLISVPCFFRKRLRHICSGGYLYPMHLEPGETCPADGGIGQLFMVRRSFVQRHGITGDPDLKKVRYSFRDDGAYFQAMVMKGARIRMTGACPFTHFGIGHRKTNEQRAVYAYTTVVCNHIFWKKYIYPRKPKVLSIPAYAWSCVGYGVIALLKCVRRRTLKPLGGLLKGYAAMFSGSWRRAE